MLLLPQGSRKQVLYRPLSILLLTSALYLSTATAQLHPHQIQAVFLFNFSKFVIWPQSSPVDPNFTICVLGKDPFGVYLDLTLEGEQADRRPLQVRRIQKLNQTHDCPILFISTSKQTQLNEILAITRNRPILTVSDIENFAQRGGTIELRKTHHKIRLIINQSSVDHAGLIIRANLLQLSDIIR